MRESLWRVNRNTNVNGVFALLSFSIWLFNSLNLCPGALYFCRQRPPIQFTVSIWILNNSGIDGIIGTNCWNCHWVCAWHSHRRWHGDCVCVNDCFLDHSDASRTHHSITQKWRSKFTRVSLPSIFRVSVHRCLRLLGNRWNWPLFRFL